MTPWKILSGSLPVLLVAAHNFPHQRLGIIKHRDMWTGDLVTDFSLHHNTWGILTTTVQPDPNWYPDSPFRQAVKHLISQHHLKLVLDIHGKKSPQPEIVVYANSAYQRQYPNSLTGLSVKNFRDDDQLTLGEDLDQDGIPTLQLEISPFGRYPDHPESTYQNTLQLLHRLTTASLEKAQSLG